MLQLFLNKVKVFILSILIIGVALPLFFIFPQIVYAEVTYPAYTGYVNDFAGILDTSTIDQITGVISEVNNQTTAEIAVVTIDNLQGITIEEYAVELFEKWGIGKKEKNNGILLLISEEDRKLRIEVGYGLEGVITDLESGRIIDNIIVPQFKAGDYNTGTYNGVIAIANEIYADAGLPAAGEVAVVESTSTKEPPFF